MRGFSLYGSLVAVILGFPFKSTCQGFQYEIGIGPEITKAVITDYSVGIIGGTKPSNDRFPMGYMLSLSVRSHASPLQVGLQLKHDYTRFNVYLPVVFPGDIDVKKSSRWNHYYEAFRVGGGCHLRYSMGNFFLQSGVSYMAGLSDKSRHDLYHGKTDTYEKIEGEDYSPNAGFSSGVSIGAWILEKTKHRLAVSGEVEFGLYNQEYTDETFLHYWKIRPIHGSLLVIYQWTKSDALN